MEPEVHFSWSGKVNAGVTTTILGGTSARLEFRQLSKSFSSAADSADSGALTLEQAANRNAKTSAAANARYFILRPGRSRVESKMQAFWRGAKTSTS
ncbi:hypothetical protein [Paucibacter sp. Y2R2-4]|uniref:hypothetical protein n=1 Tax=Paucibacter sp. Y2R2-4 TaxID=2893553 RepID=UPI0021E44F5B|nr:hypothetical protein [Paucibacter sp. Y2R2-4]MCV2351040.1 hypothetical protein [Paucibacter sp. Y2R2-4]